MLHLLCCRYLRKVYSYIHITFQNCFRTRAVSLACVAVVSASVGLETLTYAPRRSDTMPLRHVGVNELQGVIFCKKVQDTWSAPTFVMRMIQEDSVYVFVVATDEAMTVLKKVFVSRIYNMEISGKSVKSKPNVRRARAICNKGLITMQALSG